MPIFSAAGTSTVLPPEKTCNCQNILEDGSTDFNCNCIFVPYLDGGSFSGDVNGPVKVPNDGYPDIPDNATVHYRGLKNLDSTIEWAFNHGMSKVIIALSYYLIMLYIYSYYHRSSPCSMFNVEYPQHTQNTHTR